MENPIAQGKYPFRLFLLLFFPMALLILGGTWYVGQDRIEDELELIRAKEIGYVVMGVRRLDDELRLPLHQLHTLAAQPAVRQAIDRGDAASLRGLEQAFSDFIAQAWAYDKVRWIDETGRERVRVNNLDGQPQAVDGADLQDVAERYYYREAMRFRPGQYYISPLDLNVEHERVSLPHKPVLRLATPVAGSDGRARGILLLNVAARDMLDVFTQSLIDARDHAMLVNSEGYWLRSPNAEDEWGFMLGRSETLGSRYPAAWKAISAIPSGQVELEDGMWTWSTVYPLKVEGRWDVADTPYWLVISHLPDNRLAMIGSQAWSTVGSAAVILLLLFGAVAAWLARALAGRTLAQVETTRALAEADAAKRHNEMLERFHMVVEANANGLLAIDAQGRIVLANPALERMFGYERGELLSLPVEILLPESARTGHFAMRRDYQRNPESRPMGMGRDLMGRRKDGSVFPVEISLSPFIEHGEQYVDAVVVDITERKHAETLMRKREAHLRLLIESNPNGIVVLDEAGRIEMTNPALDGLFGYAPGELPGQPVESLVPEDDRERHVQMRERYLQNPVPRPMGAGRRLHGRRKDGSRFPIEVSLASFRDEGRLYVQATVAGIAEEAM